MTAENILWVQAPRNRRTAEAFARCGLVERAGQGANLMFEQAILQSKSLPDYTRSDPHHVFLTLAGQVRDPLFLKYLEKLGEERLRSFSTEHLLALDCVHSQRRIEPELRPALDELIEVGAVERTGTGRGTRYLLARRFYELTGQEKQYTRRRGLDRETSKALLVKHLKNCGANGAKLRELHEVVPAESRRTLQNMLRELREDGKLDIKGRTSAARWYATN